ncbi:MAG: cupin domain-containing protein [Muribaculaceae bacterium]|nr:cupin domain-containing protein [Muribaculaceae bacterium]
MKTNFKFGEVIKFNDAIKYNSEKVEFKTVFETTKGGVSLVALKAGQKLDTHTTPFEVMITVCEGEIEFTMLDKSNRIKAGEFFLMGADVAHSVVANIDSKLMIVKIKENPHNENI